MGVECYMHGEVKDAYETVIEKQNLTFDIQM
jgi:hypothetical protein